MNTLHPGASLVRAVSNLLHEENPTLADRFDRQFRAASNDPLDEIIDLNSFWRDQLSFLSVNTISERECLIDAIQPNDWLRHFRQQVLPTIVRFELPRVA